MQLRKKPVLARSSRALSRPAKWIAEALESRLLLSNVIWTGAAGDKLWTTPGNWSSNPALPGISDDVTINVAGNATIQVNSGTQSVNSVTSTDAVSLTGGTLTVAAASQIASLSLAGGIISGSGDLTITGTLTWTGGTMSGSGTTILASGATADLTGGGLALNREFDNNGTFTIENNTDLVANTGSGYVFDNLAGGVVNTDATDRSIGFTGGSTPSIFNNAGTFNGIGSGTTFFNSQTAFNNTGTVNVQAGELMLAGGGTIAGPITVSALGLLDLYNSLTYSAGTLVSGPGAVQFDGGTHTFASGQFLPTGSVNFVNGTATINNPIHPSGLGTITQATVVFNASQTFADLSLAQSGVISGTGNVTITGTLSWVGGHYVRHGQDGPRRGRDG